MDDEVNVTYVTLGGHVEVDKYRYVYFVIMFTVYLLIICCNSMIVYLIWIHQNLHEPMYIFIAALLINSVLYSTAIYPKLLIDFLSDKQIISYSACLFQFHVFYSLGGSEFLLLAAMAYDRYVSICKPLQYPTVMTKTTVSIFLLFAWILPAAQVAVPAGLSANKKLCSFSLKGMFCNNTVYKLQCVVSREQIIHDMIILLNVALLPVLFILFTYTRILIISYRSRREVRRKAAQTCLPHLIVLINFSCLCAYDVITVQLESDFPKTVRLLMTLQIIMYHPLFNPIIYGLKMKEISKHLRRLFCPAKIS
ncbi:olfactory receptor 6N2-like [Chaetodon trifascialis]|uniref:olfactory receptor 6N2-like n=1 Tax=Chaetodon trifascialis TaxID=109706 RepID=UPI0039932AB3